MHIIKSIIIGALIILPLTSLAQEKVQDLCEWTKTRVSNAAASKTERVRMLISSTLGWGCDCPHFVVSDSGFTSCDSMFVTITPASDKIKMPKSGKKPMERYIITGHYSGKKVKFVSSDEPKGNVIYNVPEFVIETIKVIKTKKELHPKVELL